MRAAYLLAGLCLALTAVGPATAAVWLKGGAQAAGARQILANPGLEQPGETGAADWTGWDKGGYTLDDHVAHSGQRSARCESTAPGVQHGVQQNVTLNQKTPVAILARCWSRAEKVSGAPDSGYSLYLDLTYADGTSLWGQTYGFNTGTHGWEQGSVLIMPAKPVKSLSIYGIFRGHEGTVWFDDFELYELPGVALFDLQAAAGKVPAAKPRWRRVPAGGGANLLLDPATGAMSLDPSRLGGLVLRDTGASGSFLLPKLTVAREGKGWRLTGTVDQTGLAVDATLEPIAGAVQLHATVRDLTGKDRAITAYWALPLPAASWRWCEDPRRDYAIGAARSGGDFTNVGCGANGQASRYPFGAVIDATSGIAIGSPISQPRLCRFAADGPRRVLYAAYDLGLCRDVKRSPSKASFTCLLYGFAPQWRFRAALQRYYDLNPAAFVVRAHKQGIWMPFVDIATVQGWRDFGFQFQEGAADPLFDQEHGIYSFPYIEPMSYWMSMPKGLPRTDAAALKLLGEQAAKGVQRAKATQNSALYGSDGRMWVSIEDAPWCNGALFLNNPSPGVTGTAEDPVTQYKVHEETVHRILKERAMEPSWVSRDAGFKEAGGEGRKGSDAALCDRPKGGRPMGAWQPVELDQTQPRPIVATAWSKAEGVTGKPDGDYSLYLDISYTDGTQLFGQIGTFAVGTHDWQETTVRVAPTKPIRSVGVNILFRGDHTGRAWFDDVTLREEGSDRNFVRNPGFDEHEETVRLDGLYLDSFEMGATILNYRRAQFAGAELPLVYDRNGRLCQMGYFLTMELCRAVSRQMHDAGRMTFANGVLWNYPWAAGDLDVMGTETNWAQNGKYVPNSDQQMLYWRAMADKRPYLTLLNTVFDDFPHEWVEKYFERCCYYGVLPSMFSHNAADAVYWNRPKLYDRDRDLFVKYIPVIRTISEAGWQPVTLATSDNPAVWVERYGGGEAEIAGGRGRPARTDTAYFTVFNNGEKPAQAKVTIDLQALTGGRRAGATVLLPREASGPASGKTWTTPVPLQPGQVAVLRLTW